VHTTCFFHRDLTKFKYRDESLHSTHAMSLVLGSLTKSSSSSAGYVAAFTAQQSHGASLSSLIPSTPDRCMQPLEASVREANDDDDDEEDDNDARKAAAECAIPRDASGGGRQHSGGRAGEAAHEGFATGDASPEISTNSHRFLEGVSKFASKVDEPDQVAFKTVVAQRACYPPQQPTTPLCASTCASLRGLLQKVQALDCKTLLNLG
jgi:hypothetical protein